MDHQVRFGTAFPDHWLLPHRVPMKFIGRSNALQQMTDILSGKPLAILWGSKGMGKTTLMVEFAHVHRSEYLVVLWFDCKRDMDTQYQDALKRCRLPASDEPITALSDFLKTASGKVLLVFDNANADPSPLAHEYSAHIRIVLITGDSLADVTLGALTEREGAELICQRAGVLTIANQTFETSIKGDTLKNVMRLTNAFEGVPFWLERIGAYCDQTGTGPVRFASFLDAYPLDELKNILLSLGE